jgi:hypothetical protein
MSGYGLDERGAIPGRGERIFLLASVSRPALGPIQPPVQWVPGVLSPLVKRGRGVTLTTHPRLVPRSLMSRSSTSSPLHLHRCVVGLLFFTYAEQVSSNAFIAISVARFLFRIREVMFSNLGPDTDCPH